MAYRSITLERLNNGCLTRPGHSEGQMGYPVNYDDMYVFETLESLIEFLKKEFWEKEKEKE